MQMPPHVLRQSGDGVAWLSGEYFTKLLRLPLVMDDLDFAGYAGGA